jgi:hypothetical protein
MPQPRIRSASKRTPRKLSELFCGKTRPLPCSRSLHRRLRSHPGARKIAKSARTCCLRLTWRSCSERILLHCRRLPDCTVGVSRTFFPSQGKQAPASLPLSVLFYLLFHDARLTDSLEGTFWTSTRSRCGSSTRRTRTFSCGCRRRTRIRRC